VWCHERCYKQDMALQRKRLDAAARAAGAELLCLKKASKFGQWLTTRQRPPYVLLTDWREAKPCLAGVALKAPFNQPCFTVILCEESKAQFDRAATWAEELAPRQGPVHVCPDLGLLRSLLAEVASGARLAPVPLHAYGAPLAARMPTPLVPSTMAMLPAPRAVSMGMMGPEQMVALEQAQYSPGSAVPPSAQLLSTVPLDRPKAASWDARAATLAGPVAKVLSPVCARQSVVQVEQLLQAAMPEVYDE